MRCVIPILHPMPDVPFYRSAEFTVSASRETSSSAWVKWQYPTKRVKAKSGKYITTGGKQVLQLWKASCYEREYDITSVISYDRNGKVLGSDSYVAFKEPVVPGTVGEIVYNYICANDDESYLSNDYELIDSAAAAVDSAAVGW
ncbi:surface-adhesin E family protein [Kaistella sp.]|uniref:surface-adhesin E family protein n=1 Tax=Kaistella sp. TaxID=2782235 RepID=UPI002F91C961